MRNLWLRFGCFLTGYNYSIVNRSSEITAKAVKRYTSAMIIICILWAFIGFTFTDRYLKGGLIGSIAGALIMCIIIVQVERQIILSVKKNIGLFIFRGVIAVTMAIIGSIIIDQIIFKEDIEQEKYLLLDEKVKMVLPAKVAELKTQIKDLDSAIINKENERKQLIEDLTKNPTIKTIASQKSNIPIAVTVHDSLVGPKTKINYAQSTTSTVGSIQNPKFSLLEPLDKQILGLREQKEKKDSALISSRDDVENELREKVGFLDELIVMKRLISKSDVALFVWLIWILFLLGLELFVLISKVGESRNDYDETIQHQMDIHKKRLRLLANTTAN